MTPVLALDLSNWTTDVPVPGAGASGLITPALVRCWRDHGFSHAIIGTQWPDVARHQLSVCHAAGMTVDLYSWLSWTRPSRLGRRWRWVTRCNGTGWTSKRRQAA